MSAFALILTAWGAAGGLLIDPRDGESYATVRLGGLRWMAEDLRHAAAESVCYDFAQANCARGRLYSFEVAGRACPSGWRLPSDADWMRLESAIGMSGSEIAMERARGDKGDRLKQGGDTGFNGHFAGYLDPHRNAFRRAGQAAAYWTSTVDGADDVSPIAWHRDLNVARSGIYRSRVNVTYKLSVRCVADADDTQPVDTPAALP